jgi:hypothetical protein
MTHSTQYRRILNSMGYYNYQNGLIYRHLNQEGGWDTHLDRCRSYILKAMEVYRPEKVTVLGSGWLLELPVAEMLEKTKKIVLVDIVHPPDVISQAGTFNNIELTEEDVTGGLIEAVWKKSHSHRFLNKLRTIADISVPEYKPESDPGMVISLNILTQLEVLLTDYLRKRSDIKEEEYLSFRREIQRKHIDFLMKHNSVLITDISEIFTDKSGKTSSVPTLLCDLPPGKLREEWVWNFDLKGSDYYNSRSIMNVLAITL